MKMTDRRNKPTIVSLGDPENRIGSDVSNVPKDHFEIRNERVPRCKPTEGINPNLRNYPLTPEFDTELCNDFKWLIHFDLKAVWNFDIDEDFHEDDESKVVQTKQPLHRELISGKTGKIALRGDSLNRTKKSTSHSKPVNSFVFAEIIEQCLCEKTEVTVKGIFKWIRDQYPCFKSNDCKWKNYVRLTLVKNPLFKVKKSKTGKSDVWYFDRTHPEDSRHSQLQHQDTSVTQMNSDRPRLFQQNQNSNSAVLSPAKEYFTVYGLVADAQGKFESYSESWLEYTGCHVKEYIDVASEEYPAECYEIEIPLATPFLEAESYTESLEIMPFTDGSSSSVSLGLM